MLLEIVILLLMLVFAYNYWSLGYWKRRNVFTVKPQFFFGHTKDIFMAKLSLHDFFRQMYEQTKEHKLVGLYSFYNPSLIINDPDLIKQVLVKDFNSFTDPGCDLSPKVDPITASNPFLLKGDKWKKTRSMHVAMLTPSKLKEMYQCIMRIGDEFVRYLCEKTSPLEINDITKFYTIDTVATCVFGLEPSAFKDSNNNAFVNNANDTMFSTSAAYTNVCCFFFPLLHKILSIRIASTTLEEFFISITRQLVNSKVKDVRKSNSYIIDQLISTNENNKEQKKQGFTDTEYAGHLFTFYINAVETTSAILSYIFVELANFPDVQDRLRDEILTAKEEHGGKLDSETILSLKYLNMVIQEILRMHHILPAISRTCTQPTTLGGVKIEKGVKIFIPVCAIQIDSRYYKDPEKFDPERFSDGSKNIMKGTYAPFGDGPRQCIGMKFAQSQLKLGIASILPNFTIHSCEDNNQDKQTEIITEVASFIISPKKGTKLHFKQL